MDVRHLPPVLSGKIDVDSTTGCWIWIAAKDPLGYGRVRWDGKVRFAHRVVYALLVGEPGPELDHVCRTPSCVVPDHLEPVTHMENVRRGRSGQKDRWPIGRLCPAGHVIAGDNLYSTYSEKWKRFNNQCRQCRADTMRRRNARLKAKRQAEGAFGTK